MKYRAYFKLQFTLLSPLSIGDSFSEKTDRDVILDSHGQPVIPATSIAGVLRSLSNNKDALFGCLEGKKRPQQDSQFVFYDAALDSGSAIAARDCVALDRYKVAKPGAKFDFRAVEPGAVFVGYAEAHSEDAKAELEKLLGNALSFGSKTTRGYGKVELAYQCSEFQPDQTEEWLAFDMFDWPDDAWISVTPQANPGKFIVKLHLKQRGGLSIRQYLTDLAQDNTDKEKGADYGPTSLRDGTPVIPGTSWAGLFKHHMEALLGKELPDVFGFVDEETKECRKSKISFGESRIENGASKLLTRNMIDRFTNGTKDGALYTEQTVYGGTTELEITLDKDISSDVKRALCVTILDMHNGYAALGGLTAVGRGLFEIMKVNEKELDGTYDMLVKEIIGCD